MKEPTPWLSCYSPNPNAKIRLFCFPFAGGGSSIFRTWNQDLPTWVEVCPVQFPGRENRIREKPFKNMQELITTTVKALAPYFDLPFVFFGHSMGASIAYSLTRYLRKNNNLLPKHLLVSGRLAPHIADKNKLYALPEKEFREKLKKYNGTPAAILENEEIMQLIIPLLRADFSVCETNIYTPDDPLDCSLSAFSGENDSLVDFKDLQAWQQHTTRRFRIELFPGDHFFLRDVQKDLLKSISRDLEQCL